MKLAKNIARFCRSARSKRAARAGSWVLMRGIWLALVALHIAPLIALATGVAAGPTLENTLSLAVLTVVVALFGLKAADAPFLRLRRPSVELLIFAICAVLAHGDILHNHHLTDFSEEVTTTAAVFFSGSVLVIRPVRRSLLRLFGRLRVLAQALNTPFHTSQPLVPELAYARSNGALYLKSPRPPPSRSF